MEPGEEILKYLTGTYDTYSITLIVRINTYTTYLIRMYSIVSTHTSTTQLDTYNNVDTRTSSRKPYHIHFRNNKNVDHGDDEKTPSVVVRVWTSSERQSSTREQSKNLWRSVPCSVETESEPPSLAAAIMAHKIRGKVVVDGSLAPTPSRRAFYSTSSFFK